MKENNIEHTEDENFMEVAVGNFIDCVRNAVYGLQKYIDNFFNPISEIYTDEIKIKDPNVRKVINFVLVENESIIKNKGTSFANEVNNLLLRKYDSLIESIEKESDKYKYRISEDAYTFLDKFQDDIDWQNLQLNAYSSKKYDDMKLLFEFNKFMEMQFKRFAIYSFQASEIELSKNEFITILDSAFLRLVSSMMQIRRILDNSTSLYTMSVSCRKVIEMSVMLYYILETIELVEVE